MGPIIAFVGGSGVGKTTLMMELLRCRPKDVFPIKTLGTRAKRGPEDEIFYRLSDREEVQQKKANGELAQYLEYAGNFYGCLRSDIDWAVNQGFGIQAYVQPAIADLRSAGYKVIPIKIIGKGHQERDPLRIAADLEREKIPLDYKLILENSFEPGGFEKAVEELEQFLDRLKNGQIDTE